MKKFDAKIKEILIKEGIFSAIGSGIKAAENPSQGLAGAFQGIENKEKEFEKTKGQPIDVNNKPKEGQMLVYQQNKQITGKVVKISENGESKVITKDGKFGITLMQPNGQTSQFEFVKTQKKPYWRIDYVDLVTDNHINGKDIMLKENNILQVSPTVEIPFVLVGKGTAYENWIDYDVYLKGENKK